jgi:hypothetical protein
MKTPLPPCSSHHLDIGAPAWSRLCSFERLKPVTDRRSAPVFDQACGEKRGLTCAIRLLAVALLAFAPRAGQIAMKVTIPPNTSATSFVPSTNEAAVTESGRLPSQAEGVNFLRIEGHAAVYAVRSGTYRFQSTLPEGIQ